MFVFFPQNCAILSCMDTKVISPGDFFPVLHLSDASSLKDTREEDSCLFLSRSAPVAVRARQAHNVLLQSIHLPWWRRLGDDFSSPESLSHKDYDMEFESLYLGGR